MKPSHLTTPRAMNECVFMLNADPIERPEHHAHLPRWVKWFGVAVVGMAHLVSLARAALSTPAQQDAVDAEAVALSPEDADLLEQIVNDFCEDGETAVDQQELMRFANMGYLECERFMILPEAQDAIDAIRAAISAKKGGA